MDETKNIPSHVAIIPDGNRRWAKANNLTSLQGHKKGFDVSVVLSRKLRELGVHTLTIWAFSTENWDRTPKEVSYLMRLYGHLLDKYIKEAKKDNVRIIHIGRKDRLPKFLLEKLEKAQSETKNFSKHVINIAIDYGGRDEIMRGINKAAKKGIDLKTIDEKEFNNLLDTADQPHPFPDLVIRTSGEFRTSGFMPYQTAYSEYIFLDKYFPQLCEQDMEDAVNEYSKRQRRFGK